MITGAGGGMGLKDWNDCWFGIEVYCFFSTIGLMLNELFLTAGTESLPVKKALDVPKLSDRLWLISFSLFWFCCVLLLKGGLPLLEATEELFNSSSIIFYGDDNCVNEEFFYSLLYGMLIFGSGKGGFDKDWMLGLGLFWFLKKS